MKNIVDSENYAAGVEDAEDDLLCPPGDPVPAFASALTLSTLRVSILSTINLVDELLNMGFKFVLTEKFNQDCIEVRYSFYFCFGLIFLKFKILAEIFLIIWSCGRSCNKPKASSFLELFQLLTLSN